jgi:putative peptidoglycan lipid II flippase
VLLLSGHPSTNLLAAATVLGMVSEVVALFLLANRAGANVLAGVSLRSAASTLSPLTKDFFALLAGTGIGSLSPIVDQAFASLTGGGAVSTLNYGNRLIALAMGLGTASIGLVALPHFSSLAAANKWEEMAQLLKRLALATFLLALPATAILVGFAEPLVRIMFQRGRFVEADTMAVARVQAFYALQIPFHLAGIIGARVLNATQRTHTILAIVIGNAMINILADYVLVRRFGVAGIALSTSCMYVVSCTNILLCARLELRRRRVLTTETRLA